MDKTLLLNLLVTLFFIQWHSIAAESDDTVEAKFISAMNKDNDEYIAVVEDKKAKSGWAIDVKKEMSEQETEIYYVQFYTRSDPNAKFEHTSGGALWNWLDLKNKKAKFLPVQIIGMIFPTQKKTLKVDKTPILDTAQVNRLALDYKAGNLRERALFPQKTPYEMEVIMVSLKQTLAGKGEYVFKLKFNIGGDINKK